MKRYFGLGAALLLLLPGLMGCQNTAEGVEKDASTAGEAVSKGVERAGNAAGNAMETAKEATADFASDASMATTVTPKVKNAITADAALNDTANRIDVDSKDKIVHLKGTVVSNDMKRKAGEIADATLKSMNAPADIKVMNELVVQKR